MRDLKEIIEENKKANEYRDIPADRIVTKEKPSDFEYWLWKNKPKLLNKLYQNYLGGQK